MQLVPIIPGTKHPYEWIDEVIAIIKRSGIKYEVDAFSTSLEGDYRSIMQVVDHINTFLFSQKCPEWILQVQLQLRSESDMTSDEKTDKHRY